MDDFIPKLSAKEVMLAKQRIWNRMEGKLPDRGVSPYQSVMSAFHGAKNEAAVGVLDSRLRQVQSRERILDLLPDRQPFIWQQVNFQGLRSALVPRRAWAVATLSVFFAFLFVPVMSMPSAQASSYNTLEVVQGDVLVNGAVISDHAFIQQGDTVYTGPGSMAHLSFVDDSRVTVGPNTNLEVTYVAVDAGGSQTQVELQQSSGRVWSQVVGLSDESYFTLSFPDGQITANQRSSFDVQVDGVDIELQVARNLVEIDVNADGNGTLGQGALLTLTDGEVEMGELAEELKEDVWWDFNLAYGKIHSRVVEDKYKNEAIERAIILPGNPLYVFKTFREAVHETLSFTAESKEEIVAQHAENRLNEAQVLIENGDLEAAEELLDVYQATVDEKLADSDNEDLLSHLDKMKKGVMASEDIDEGIQLLDEHITETSATLTSDPSEKSEMQILSTSERLQLVPDLLEDGKYDRAFEYLSDYKESSISMLVSLEEIDMEDRDQVISGLLDQKIKDLQMLRVIGSMFEDGGSEADSLQFDSQVYQELSLMALSLRERALDRLSGFFTSTDYNVNVQQEVYVRLKGASDMDEDLAEQFDEVEEELAGVASGDTSVVIDFEVEEGARVVDTRFGVHGDEEEAAGEAAETVNANDLDIAHPNKSED
jgi:hypothetical protein